MSHFTVLVIGDDFEKQLAPYHEFECTGIDDEYVQDVDKTEEARGEFEEDTDCMLESPDGEVVSAYDDRFYRETTSEERKKNPFELRVREVPDSWVESNPPVSERLTFAAWCDEYYGYKPLREGDERDPETHKFGYVLVDADGDVVKVVDRTNPNSEWDWYLVGGRWTGFFKLKEGADGGVGEPGVMTPRCTKPGRADVAKKGDIDWDGMRDQAEEKALKRWDEYASVIESVRAEGDLPSWRKFLDAHNGKIGEARSAFAELAAVQAFTARAKELDHWFFDDGPCDRFCNGDKAAYIARARRGAVLTHAVVVNGQWYEQGSMGWWGIVTDEKDDRDWAEEFAKLVDGLPDDTQLTLVDCHI